MRKSGILCHISSLPSEGGIGTFGKSAYSFVDFLKEAGQYYWQILPLCPTGKGNSPYLSYSTFAGNPFFIDPGILIEDKLISKSFFASFFWGDDPENVDFDLIEKNRFTLLKEAYSNFRLNDDYKDFCSRNSFWLEDYAVYMVLKERFDGTSWYNWPDEYKLRDAEALESFRNENEYEISFWKFIQYLFFTQWYRLKDYANSNGVHILGDIPIYVASDSADAWSDRKEFLMDEHGNLTEVAGCPPDYFSEEGQLWGNPLYDWEYMKETGYRWWKKRISHMCKMFDSVRIDHFRGFESYYCIPADSDTAKIGEWRKGPGMDFFNSVEKDLGKLDIIAEDLGWLTDDVRQMLKDSGFPGMKVLQFAFDSDDNDYLPHHITENSVCYTGTHDNNTILGFFDSADDVVKKRAVEYMKLDEKEGYNWGMMRTCWSSKADTAIVTMQDLLSLDGKARFNTPSVAEGNWTWRMTKKACNRALARKIRDYCLVYNRINAE